MNALQIAGGGGGASSTQIEIGETVVGGTATRILYVGAGPVLADSANLLFANTQITVGSGTTTSRGWEIGYSGASVGSGWSAMWVTGLVQSGTNYALLSNGGSTAISGTTSSELEAAGATKIIAVAAGLGLVTATRIFIGTTAPTLASGGCTSPTAVTSNGTAAFSVGVGTSCSGSQPLVFTLPAAATGWMCVAKNTTNGAASAPAMTGAVSTTSVTITNFSRTLGTAAAWTDADVVVVSCLGY